MYHYKANTDINKTWAKDKDNKVNQMSKMNQCVLVTECGFLLDMPVRHIIT